MLQTHLCIIFSLLSSKRFKIRVNEVICNHAGLKEFTKSNPWFPSLVVGMLSNWIKDVNVNSKLRNLSNKEAQSIGQSFSSALRARKVAEAGVDQWVHQYPAVVELCKENSFFASMAVTIGKTKLKEAPWGLAFKVGCSRIFLELPNQFLQQYCSRMRYCCRR